MSGNFNRFFPSRSKYIGTARRIIKESITDKDLFNALMADATKPAEFNRAVKIVQGWMAADVINHLEQTGEQ